MQDVPDDGLTRMYCEGDAEAFNALFDRYHRSVYNLARLWLGSCDGAEEVLQETFLAVARSAGTYTPRGRFRAWLMRIARNRCVNHLESQRVRRSVLTESTVDPDDTAARQAPPAERIEADELQERIRTAIADLPDRQREALALYAFEQMSYGEIARVMQMPINTVKTLIYRARANLARTLEPPEAGDQK